MNDVVKTKKVTEIETVTLTDGRVVDFPGKRRIQKESFVGETGEVLVRFDFRNGETRDFVIPSSLLAKFAAHGAEQKIGDEAAGVENLDDAVACIDALLSRLVEGKWAIARDSGSSYSGASIVIRALMEATGKTKEQVSTFIENKINSTGASRQEIYKSFRGNDKIRPIIERLEAEKTAKKPSSVNAGELLNELEG